MPPTSPPVTKDEGEDEDLDLPRPQRISPPKRWDEACQQAMAALEELQELQAEYQAWRQNLPENLEATASGTSHAYPPDTTAASLWLRNRQPHRWRDKHEIDVADAGESLMDDMTEDQLIELLMLRRGVAQRKPS
jgi:hypothetical protein